MKTTTQVNSASRLLAFILLILTVLFEIPASQAEQLVFTLPESIQNLEPNSHALINKSAKNQIDQAYHFIEQSNFDSALIELSELIARYKHNAVVVSHSLRLASQILVNQDKLETAIPILQKAIYLDSLEKNTILDMKLMLAKLYLQVEKYSDSLSLFQAYIKERPKNENIAQVYYLLAYTQYQLKQYEVAIASTKKGLATKPKDKTALLSIQLNSLLELKDYSKAEKVLVKLVQLQPTQKSYWNNWINILRQQDKNKPALASIELMMQQHPLTENETRIYIHLLLEQNFPERAARQLQLAIDTNKIEPQNKNYYLLSQAWEKAGQPEEAIQALEAIKEQDKNSLTRLVYLYIYSKKWHSLIKLIDTNYALLKDEDWVWMHKAQAYFEIAETDKAISLLEQLVSKTNIDDKIKASAEQWLAFYQP
jgi:predicted Zn-dependent protease